MRAHRFWLFLATALIWTAWSCGDDGNKKSGPQGCVPQSTQVCVCPGGAPGAQMCLNDGSGYTVCNCGQADTTDPPDTTGTLDTGEPTDTSAPPVDTSQPSDTLPPKDTPTPSDIKECDKNDDCPATKPECTPQGICVVCYPGIFTCDEQLLMQCKGDGSGYELSEDCAATGKTCNPNVGTCESPCGGFAKLQYSNAGCDFFAVDLHNAIEATQCSYLDAQAAPFAVIASNTSDTTSAQVTVTYPDGQTQQTVLAPQKLTTFMLPSNFGQDGTKRSKSAFRIQSNSPIVAYQFNPLSNVDVFSNDASVLLPVSAQGQEYYVVSLAHFKAGSTEYPAYFTIVGVHEQPTEVTVHAAAQTKAGGDLPSLSPGAPQTFTVAQAEVLNFESQSGDLTGSQITSTGPIMVFSGHTAGRPVKSECCSDHLEQQMAPVFSWGKEYVIGRSMERGSEPDYLRIVASKPGTQVSVYGSASPASFTLGPGQYQEVKIQSHVRVTASQPVMVAQFLASNFEAGSINKGCNKDSDCGQAYTCGNEDFQFGCQFKPCSNNAECGPGHTCAASKSFPCNKECRPIGDPAMMMAVPIEQWQTDFVFLTPDSYAEDYINIVGPTGAQIYLDGQLIPPGDFESLSGSNYSVYRTKVSDGVHTITAEAPVSVLVYGYDAAVSYGYPGAMGFKSP